MVEKLLTVREASSVLGLSEKDIIDLVKEGKIPAYRIAGEFLRFREDQIKKIKPQFKPSTEKSVSNSKESLSDFFYYNDFYIASVVIIAIIIFFIIR